jgi:phosphatidylcholine synthase
MLRRVGYLMAWLVHLYTACSAVLGLWAVVASFAHQFRLAMLLMLATLAIDATDGALARAARVRDRIPWFDGRRLDDICDYFTYVLVPACFMIETGLLPHPAWAAAPILASAYGFSRADAKTDDHFFLGWPSYWNVLAVYLYLFGVSVPVTLGTVLILAVAVFIPLRYVYPSRTRVLRRLTLPVLALWTLALAGLVIHPDPNRLWLSLSLVGPAYYFGLSITLNLPRARAGTGLP